MDKEKKDSAEEPELPYTVQGDTFAGSWAPPATSPLGHPLRQRQQKMLCRQPR